MKLIGLTHNESLKEKPEKIKVGEIVICKVPTSTLTKSKEYKVLGHFSYHKKGFDLGDYWWSWFQFFTLKNDEGYTIKVNRYKFLLKSDILKKVEERERYENNPLNILSEAQGLVEQKYN